MSFDIPNGAGATFTELVPQSPRINVTQTGVTATRFWLVPWLDLTKAIAGILGSAKAGFISDNVHRKIVRTPPAWFSGLLNSAGKPYLWATKVGIKGLNPQGNDAVDRGFVGVVGAMKPYFGKMILEISYEPLDWEIESDGDMISVAHTINGVGGIFPWYVPPGGNVNVDQQPDESYLLRYITIRPKPQAESFGVPTGTYRDVAAGTPVVSVGLNKSLVTWDLEVIWHQIPRECLPCAIFNQALTAETGNIELALGKINKRAFAGCAIGTLLFLGCEIRPLRSSLGDRIYDVCYRFKRIQVSGTTLTHLFHKPPSPPAPAAQLPIAWYEISSDGTTNITGPGNFADSKSLYDWADFRVLFRAQP